MKNYRETLDDNNKSIYDLFVKYKPKSNTFIETGCHYGGGLVKAIHAGYTKLYSCDIYPDRIEKSIGTLNELIKEQKKGEQIKPYLFNMDSIKFLATLLPTIDTDATFWLDAHDEGGGFPLFRELDLIGGAANPYAKDSFKNKTSTIIMDDISLYLNKTGVYNIKNQIKEINPDYNFEFIDTSRTDSVLVAYIG